MKLVWFGVQLWSFVAWDSQQRYLRVGSMNGVCQRVCPIRHTRSLSQTRWISLFGFHSVSHPVPYSAQAKTPQKRSRDHHPAREPRFIMIDWLISHDRSIRTRISNTANHWRLTASLIVFGCLNLSWVPCDYSENWGRFLHYIWSYDFALGRSAITEVSNPGVAHLHYSCQCFECYNTIDITDIGDSPILIESEDSARLRATSLRKVDYSRPGLGTTASLS